MNARAVKRRVCAERDGGWLCAYCRCELIEPTEIEADPRTAHYPDGSYGWDAAEHGVWPATLDHVDASLVGPARDALSNLVLSCLSCNSTKGARGAEFVIERVRAAV